MNERQTEAVVNTIERTMAGWSHIPWDIRCKALAIVIARIVNDQFTAWVDKKKALHQFYNAAIHAIKPLKYDD